MVAPAPHTSRWLQAWPDAVGFGLGLALAWHFRWETRELVWSLWLSSLVIGYAMIVWSIFGPVWLLSREGDRLATTGALVGGLATLVFFTFHFGMFHFVHAAF